MQLAFSSHPTLPLPRKAVPACGPQVGSMPSVVPGIGGLAASPQKIKNKKDNMNAPCQSGWLWAFCRVLWWWTFDVDSYEA